MTLLKGQRVLYLRYGRRWPAIVLKVTAKRIVLQLVGESHHRSVKAGAILEIRD